jgi:hypothetical protein
MFSTSGCGDYHQLLQGALRHALAPWTTPSPSKLSTPHHPPHHSKGPPVYTIVLGTPPLRPMVTWHLTNNFGWLGIRGTQVKSSIQDIVDEVAPIKKAPLWG